MRCQVVTVCSRIPGDSEPYYRPGDFYESLRRFGETPITLGQYDQWKGLNTKPYLLREWLRAGCNTSDYLIVCDAFDVMFCRHPHDIADRCKEMCDHAILFNTEKGLFPRGDLVDKFPGEEYGSWRYLNSGVYTGYATDILNMLEAMDIDSVGFDRLNPDGSWNYPNDQGEFQQLFAQKVDHSNPILEERNVKLALDTKCTVFQTLSACTEDEFEITDKAIKNLATGTTPGIVHLNGSGMNILGPIFREKWGY